MMKPTPFNSRTSSCYGFLYMLWNIRSLSPSLSLALSLTAPPPLSASDRPPPLLSAIAPHRSSTKLGHTAALLVPTHLEASDNLVPRRPRQINAVVDQVCK